MDSSNLRPYAVGNVVIPATPSSPVGRIEIFLTELTANLNATFEKGVVGIQEQKPGGVKGSIKDKDGFGINVNTIKEASITATWYGGGSNRVTAPNVCVGEMVEVWRVGDSDKYYWRTMFYQPDIRASELALYAWSDIDRKEEPSTIMNLDNSLFLTVSPLTKEFKITTPSHKGKYTAWTIHLDYKDAILEIYNDKGNSFKMTEEDMEINTKKYTLNAETIEVNGSKSVTTDTPDNTIKGGKLKVDSNTTHNEKTTFNSITNFNARAKINKNSFVISHAIVI